MSKRFPYSKRPTLNKGGKDCPLKPGEYQRYRYRPWMRYHDYTNNILPHLMMWMDEGKPYNYKDSQPKYIGICKHHPKK